jgi:hypothetical protein
MANERVFDSIVYKESYMDMKAFSFKIREEPFLFCLSYQHQGQMTLEQAKTVEEIRDICQQVEDVGAVTHVQWKWTTLRYASSHRRSTDDDDESECDETDMDDPHLDGGDNLDEDDDTEPEQLEIQPPKRKRKREAPTAAVPQLPAQKQACLA